MRFLLWYYIRVLTTFVLVSSDVITLIRENNVTCVLTDDFVYSAVYIKNYENSQISRKIEEAENWGEDEWKINRSNKDFDMVIDERWIDFNFTNTVSGRLNYTAFSVCLNESSSIDFQSADYNDTFTLLHNSIKITLNNTVINTTDIPHAGKKNKPESECQWNHVTIKSKNNVTLSRENQTFRLNFPLKFDLKWWTFSKLVYKSHNYSYRYSNTPSSKKFFLYVNRSVCVSMYVSVDEGCYLNVTLEFDNTIFDQHSLKATNQKGQLRKWMRVELRSDNNNEKYVSFFRGTDHGEKSGYWAVDEVRDCSSSIVTYNIVLTNSSTDITDGIKNPVCQTLNSSSLVPKINSCGPPYIGEQCNINCSQILGSTYPNCEQHRICSRNECFCAWGYHGPNCNKICETKHWGINCAKKCNKGCKYCDKLNGTCVACEPQYYGSNCSKKLPVVRQPPTLVSLKENFIEILPNLKYGENEEIPQYYAVQYKHINHTDEKFKFFGSNHTYSNKSINRIQMNLTTTQTYKVRILLITDNISYDVNVPDLIINKKSLRLSEGENSIELTWDQPHLKNATNFSINYKCPNTFCSTNTENKTQLTNKTFASLKIGSFSSCDINLYAEINKEYVLIDQMYFLSVNANKALTADELPRNLTFSENAIFLEMETCDKFNGPVKYSVSCTCLKNWCNKENIKQLDYEFKTYTSNILLNLTLWPYTLYNISVTATRLEQREIHKNFVDNTPPTKPYSVEKLSVYRYFKNTLWIKWREKYPPTGKTEKYYISLQNKKNEIIAQTNTTSPCELWKNYRCAKLSDHGNFNTSYGIEVYTKNQEVSEYSPKTRITFWKNASVTSMPANLNIKVSAKITKTINLSWEYPYYTYGKPLEKFFIRVNDDNPIVINMTDRENYIQMIPVDYGKRYNISVWAKNEFDSEKANINLNISYPIKEISPNPFVIWCFKNCYLAFPEPVNDHLEFTIQNNRPRRGKGLNLDNVCTANDKCCIISKEDTGNLSLHLVRNGRTINIPIKFTTNKDITKSAGMIVGIGLTMTLLLTLGLGIGWWLYKRKKLMRDTENDYKVSFLELLEMDPLLTNELKEENAKTFIKIENFEAYFLSALEQEKNIIVKEFQDIPKISKATCNDGRLPENADKNRYPNILPYDKTRVHLINNSGSDYINANYINGYRTPKAFIATQAPKDSAVNDFWLMVFQENVEIIVMLTEVKEGNRIKSAQYWPEHLNKYRFGEILIQNISTKITPNYVHRELRVENQYQSRLVHHFQYTTWPDHGVPLNVQDFTKFIKEIMSLSQQNPVVVHCNAGCGRTGTYILCDISIRMGINEKQIDFGSILRDLREQRMELVSNVEQYVFSHSVVFEYFFGKDFSVEVSKKFHSDIKKALSKDSLNLLTYRLKQAKKKYEKIQLNAQSLLTNEQRTKNRFHSILPGSSQIFLPISAQNTSDYINAIYVDCYRYPNKYIVTQQPLPETINDFWNLVVEYEIDTIVSLNKITDEDPLCPIFWPQDNNRSWILDNIDAVISLLSTNDNHSAYTMVRIKLDKRNEKKSQIINIISMKNWTRETIGPPSLKDLIYVWKKSTACSGKMVVTCYDGATASGLFVAFAYMIEKIHMEHKCDVFTAVKTVQVSRPQFVEHPEQLKLLYEVAVEYVQEFSTYGNFN